MGKKGKNKDKDNDFFEQHSKHRHNDSLKASNFNDWEDYYNEL